MFLKTADLVTVSESAPSSFQIYKLSAVQYQEGIVYSFNKNKTSADAMSKFTLNEIVGSVSLGQQRLDYESIKQYDLYFYAMNFIDRSLVSNEFALKVIVADSNDNAPVFNETSYSFNVAENSPARTVIGNVFATDADGTVAYRNVTYYMLNEELRDLFAVGELTGQLAVKTNKLDRETKDNYKLTVCASDNSRQVIAQVKCVLVYITVTNVEEGVPTFSQTDYSAHISEKSAFGKMVFQLSAVDVDKTPVTYVYSSQTSPRDAAKFTLDKNTGLVKINATLDSKVQSVFILYVVPVDSVTKLEGPAAKLTIRLLGDDASCPVVFTSSLYIFNVPEDTSIGTKIGAVSATYHGRAPNGEIVYYMSKSQDSDYLVLGSTSGDLTLARGLDYESRKIYFTLTVCANDSVSKSGKSFFYTLDLIID